MFGCEAGKHEGVRTPCDIFTDTHTQYIVACKMTLSSKSGPLRIILFRIH